MELLILLGISFGATLFFTPVVSAFARRFGVVDTPDGGRHRHENTVPLMGGVAVFFGLAIGLLAGLLLGWFPGEYIKEKYIIGIMISAGLLALGGFLDDKYDLAPKKQIIWPLAAVLVIILSGIGMKTVTNPFGGILYLDTYKMTVLWWDGLPYRASLLADMFTLVWLMMLTYTTKFMDGLDGLVSGVAVIGALIVAAVSLTRDVSQPDTAMLALIVAGAFLGFLVYNFHPAKIFLGEGGSTMAGFLLGTVAIVAGGKIATTLLILGLPLFDAIAVVIRRVFAKGKSMTSGDRSHLHFLLLELGLSQREAVLGYYFVAALFGSATLVLEGWEKVVALGSLLSLLAFVIGIATLSMKRKREDGNDV